MSDSPQSIATLHRKGKFDRSTSIVQAIIVAVVQIVLVPPLLDSSTCKSNFMIHINEFHYSLHIHILSHMANFKFQLNSLLTNEVMPYQSCKSKYVYRTLFNKSSHICRWTTYYILLVIHGENVLCFLQITS